MPQQKEYCGRRTKEGAIVTVNGRPLNPRHDLRNHSPDGFEWGYNGSGPAQLALAILADHLEDDDLALGHYQDFKSAVVAGFQNDLWTLTGQEVSAAFERISSPDLDGPS